MAEKKELTAPFYMLTYGDMMTLLLTFFVLLFSMATIQQVKFESSIGAIKGSLGILQDQPHAPMQVHLPAPSVKQKARSVKRSSVKPTTLQPLSEYEREDLTEPMQREESKVEKVLQLALDNSLKVEEGKEEIILYLPTFGLFERGEYVIERDNPQVQKLEPLYTHLAKQIAILTEYDVHFVGHTDAIHFVEDSGPNTPKTSLELGFLRALNMYAFFFESYLPDKTKITFASQGDNVPLIQNAQFDSERRKNRRVQIHLKKRL